jgi:hypothetical protein
MPGSGNGNCHKKQPSIQLFRLIICALLLMIGQTSSFSQVVPKTHDMSAAYLDNDPLNQARLDTLSCLYAPVYRWKARPLFARMAFHLSGGPAQYKRTVAHNPGNHRMIPVKTIFPETGKIHHQISPTKLRLCCYTHQDSIFNATEWSVSGKNRRQIEKNWVNYLLGNFFMGEGPENIYFPSDTEPALYLSEALIVKRAIKQYTHAPAKTTDSTWIYHGRFGVIDLISTIIRPLSIKHFTGSAEIRIYPFNDTMLMITVINITSLTSADYTTHLKGQSRWPVSIPRQFPGQPLSNTCQVYNIFVPFYHSEQNH